jgi:hypothetical protein
MVGAATSGGIDGQDVIVFNDTGYTLTFAVNTVDPVPANRINTPSGSDVALANQGWASFIYDATDARWKLINVYQPTVNSVAVSTNAVSMLTASTNINFGNGLTGYVSGATAHIGVSVAGSVSGGSGNGAWVYTGETTLTESAATSFVLISCGSGKYSGAKVFLTFKATNGSDWNIRTMEWNVSTYNDGTGITPTTIDSYHGSWAGTFDSTVTSDIAADGTTGYFIRATVTPTGIGSGTTIVAKWHVWVNTDESPLTVTPQ